MPKTRPAIQVLIPMLAVVMAACGGPSPNETTLPPLAAKPSLTESSPTLDAATRTAPVVVGRPARVFVFAGWDTACQPLAAPEITILAAPTQGEISFRTGQETTIAASATGTCGGRKVTGTGVYYTARAGAAGTDRFALEARLASGETSSRTFEVRIVE
jgi:hypothetical protein